MSDSNQNQNPHLDPRMRFREWGERIDRVIAEYSGEPVPVTKRGDDQPLATLDPHDQQIMTKMADILEPQILHVFQLLEELGQK